MKPFSQFRMPVFFFVAGLFAAFSLKRDLPTFVDRTLLPLLYQLGLGFAPWQAVRCRWDEATQACAAWLA